MKELKFTETDEKIFNQVDKLRNHYKILNNTLNDLLGKDFAETDIPKWLSDVNNDLNDYAYTCLITLFYKYNIFKKHENSLEIDLVDDFSEWFFNFSEPNTTKEYFKSLIK